jgi:hypothetical protein
MTRTLLVLLAIGVAGCDRPPGPVEVLPQPVSSRVDSPIGSIEVSVSASEIQTVEMLDVRVVILTEAGVATEQFAFDPAAAGWTVAHESAGAASAEVSGRFRVERRYALEPFLPGDYEVPSAGARLRLGDDEPILLETQPQFVRVVSVLSESDRELSPVRSLAEAPAAATPSFMPWIVAGACVGVVMVGALVMYSRRRPTRAQQVSTDWRSMLEADATDDRQFARAALALLWQVAGLDTRAPTPRSEDIAQHLLPRLPAGQCRALLDLLRALDAALYASAPLDHATRQHVLGVIDGLAQQNLAALDESEATA